MAADLKPNQAHINCNGTDPECTRQSHPAEAPAHEMIAERAFEIWQRHGCPSGTSFQDWLAAEAELRCVLRHGRRERRRANRRAGEAPKPQRI